MIIVYTQNVCKACEDAKRFLEGNGFTFETRNITENPEYKRQVLALGATSTPVIVVDNKPIFGFNREFLSEVLGV